MDDFMEQVAYKRSNILSTLLYLSCWLVVILCALNAVMNLYGIIGIDYETGTTKFSLISLIMTVIFGGIAFFAWRAADYSRVEYDYTFTNGVFDVSRVMNNKRRKYLTSIEMKEVIRCGPAKGPAFTKTLNEPNIKKHNWFINRDAKLYYFYFQKKGGKHVIIVELTDAMIEMMRSKSSYIQRGAWYDADGTQNYGKSIS
ncbi:MAG: hypothetical protein IKM02_04635 [Clostridia bacterium]|nr:hypothetical protein [Clostridia bacterium]